MGGTLIGSAVWADSGSTIMFNQSVTYYASNGWVSERVRGGVETGSAVTRVFQDLNVSRRVVFSSKGRSDELELTIRIPQLSLVFTHIVVTAERSGDTVAVKRARLSLGGKPDLSLFGNGDAPKGLPPSFLKSLFDAFPVFCSELTDYNE
ncbi:MAG: hypothetical protein QXU11_08775 [Thermoproteota archaeon]